MFNQLLTHPTKKTAHWLMGLMILCLSQLAQADSIKARVIDVPTASHLLLLDPKGVRYVIELSGISLEGLDARQHRQIIKRLRGLLMGKPVTAEVTRINHNKIMLGRVFFGGLDINLRLLSQGLAKTNRQLKVPPSYVQAEKKAQNHGMGIWSQKQGIRFD